MNRINSSQLQPGKNTIFSYITHISAFITKKRISSPFNQLQQFYTSVLPLEMVLFLILIIFSDVVLGEEKPLIIQDSQRQLKFTGFWKT